MTIKSTKQQAYDYKPIYKYVENLCSQHIYISWFVLPTAGNRGEPQ